MQRHSALCSLDMGHWNTCLALFWGCLVSAAKTISLTQDHCYLGALKHLSVWEWGAQVCARPGSRSQPQLSHGKCHIPLCHLQAGQVTAFLPCAWLSLSPWAKALQVAQIHLGNESQGFGWGQHTILWMVHTILFIFQITKTLWHKIK